MSSRHIPQVPDGEIARALDAARTELTGRLEEILASGERVLGVHGPPQVGKSTVLRQALGRYCTRHDVGRIDIDLDAAYDPDVVLWQWARGLARALVGGVVFSHLTEMPPSMHPGSSRAQLVDLRRTLGPIADVAFDDGPAAASSITFRQLAVATERAAATRRLLVCVDHLEVPELTARHPVDVGALLWDLRATMQRTRTMQIVLGARSAVVELAAGPKAAFAGDGTWVELGPPPRGQWQQICAAVGVEDLDFVDEALDLTAGNVRAMQRLLGASDSPSARERFDLAADQSDLLASRYLEHARSVHRYGAQLLLAIARQLPLRSDRTGALNRREIDRALPKLAVAGLIYRQGRDWQLTDPVVAHLLAGKDPHTRRPLEPLNATGVRVEIRRSASDSVSASDNAHTSGANDS